MSHWNYRVIRHDYPARVHGPEESEVAFEVHEVHYDDEGKPKSYRENTSIYSDSVEGLGWILEKLKEAIAKPVLSPADFTKEVPCPPPRSD
jgi:hypothetical protein